MEDFYIEKKMYYHDTDCGGVVYYANYLKYLEEGRSEFCLSKGLDLKGLVSAGTYFVVARVEIDYKAPAKYQDNLKIYTRIEKVGGSSVYFRQEIKRDNMTVVEAKTIWVCVNREFKVKPIPQEAKKYFSTAN
uniref:4-hydroxybenzoyl-CoA thioesterase n=1 Tax=uncultured microorganism TaxID=358574 RepID=F8UHM2_9ZZZZ|nr:4-hydroxybenzoyl-CoA thioesterase [uncultured microorganism]